jgi:hypothetical protein
MNKKERIMKNSKNKVVRPGKSVIRGGKDEKEI